MLTEIFLFYIFALSLVNAANNGVARTPPMGWMSWTKFYCQIDCVTYPNACINEALYKSMADRMVADGYLAAGYNYVHIDDCWLESNRDTNGKLVANKTRFPSGIDGLAKYMHDKGLKLGIYEDVGFQTCQGYPGSWGHETVDAQTFASWGVDYLKYDSCFSNDSMRNVGYPNMANALLATGRPIAFSTEWQDNDSGDLNAVAQYANLQREWTDISRSWCSVIGIVDHFISMQGWFTWTGNGNPVGPGFWIDPDMIVVGNAELTLEQAQSQMTIWSIWSAPLIMSNDLRDMPPGHKEILLNKYVIGIDQDPMGVYGEMKNQTGNIMKFVKRVTPCIGGTPEQCAPWNSTCICSYAVAMINRGYNNENGSFVFQDLGLTNQKGYTVMDLWAGQLVGTFMPNQIHFSNVPAMGSYFLKATVLQ